MPAHDEMNLNSAGAQRPVTDDVPGLPVAGYKPTQPPAAIAAVNMNKDTEELLLRDLEWLASCTVAGNGFDADKRWLQIARTHFEQGFMAMNRAIFQPARIEGDLMLRRARQMTDDQEPADPSAAALTHGA